MRYVREARESDIPALLDLAKTVNFINLPPFEPSIRRIVERSQRSFDATNTANDPPPDDQRAERTYVFVLADSRNDACIGTSALRAGMGDHLHPNLSYQLVRIVRQSSDLAPAVNDEDDPEGRPLVTGRVEHIIAKRFEDRSSPTELGGLLLPPERRGGGLGKLLSWVRFHFIARHAPWFSDRMLAEMMSPNDPYNDGNIFWRAVIKKFINLSYDDADRLSTRKREFMYTLLPHTLNLTLLADEVVASLGKVNPVTKPARTLLEEIGFQFVQRIDPFDAGPHLEAARDDITVIKQTSAYEYGEAFDPGADEQFDPTLPAGDFVPVSTAGHRGLVSTSRPGEGFRAVNARYLVGQQGRLLISADAARALKLEAGEQIWLTPYEIPADRHGDAPLPTINVSPKGPVTPAQIEAELRKFSGRPLEHTPQSPSHEV